MARLLTRKNPSRSWTWMHSGAEAERKTIQMRTEELQSKRNTVSSRSACSRAKASMPRPRRKPPWPGGGPETELETSAARLDAIQVGHGEDAVGRAQPAARACPWAAMSRQRGSAPLEHRARAAQPFPAKDHVDLGDALGWTSRWASSSGSRFTVMKGLSPACTAPWPSSCWTCRPPSTATPSATRPTSSTATA